MADKELHELTSGTPTLTDITVFGGPSGGAEVKKSTFQSIRDLFKTYFDTIYQAVLQSGVNIRTLNGNTLLGSTDLTLPVLTDGDKGDITLSSSGTVWTIDNDVVTNAKMANIASGTFKGRTTVGTGDPEDMTATQATALLTVATTSLKGLMSSTDKTKLDGLSNEWALLASSSFTAGGTYDSGTLTTYDEYKVFIKGYTTGASGTLNLETGVSGANQYANLKTNTSGSTTRTSGDDEFQLFTTSFGSGYPFIGDYYIERSTNSIKGSAIVSLDASFNSTYLTNGYVAITFSKVALTLCNAISGTIKIYGRNY